MKRDRCHCAICWARGRSVLALSRRRWLGNFPICRACKASAKEAAAKQAAAAPAPLGPLQKAFLQGATGVSLTAFARPANVALH